jgi:subtilisin family serine protease
MGLSDGCGYNSVKTGCLVRSFMLLSGKSRGVLPVFMVFLLMLAVLPVQSQVSADGPGVSTYIVVFNDVPGVSAAASQAGVADFVSAHGGNVEYRYSLINGIVIEMPDSEAGELSSLPNVKYVEKDGLVQAQLDQAVPQIGANQVWDLGYNGSGVKVAIVDSGIDGDHPDLNGGKIVAWADFVNGQNATPYDDYGHGTHCAGIAAGTGSASDGLYTGVAPGASLMDAKVLNETGSGYFSDLVKGIEWAVANNAQVISLSLGAYPHNQTLDDAVDSAIEQGVIVVVAAGNYGEYGSGYITCPGDDPNAITVGAVYDNDTIAPFSSTGLTYDGHVKPDIIAPGVWIISAKAGGNSHTGYYMTKSGTSMATPMIAGTVALMLQKNSSLTPAQVKDILENTAKPLKVNLTDPIPNNVYGWGRVQAKCAVDNVTISMIEPGRYPRTVWSDQGKTGTVVGRVVASTDMLTGIAGAYVAIVNASNVSEEYYSTISDAYGNYQITGVNATYSSMLLQGPNGETGDDYLLGTSMYKIYAYRGPYGEGWSQSFGIDTNESGAAMTSVVLFPPEANMCKYGERTVWSDMGKSGSALGRVTTSVNDTIGLPDAYIALVNASNVSQEYCNTTSDANGNYLITCINATYSSVLQQGPHGQTGLDYTLGLNAYKIYASKSPYGEGWSQSFGIDANESGAATAPVVIFPDPARIDLVAERCYVAANGSDKITITAYMYDALGNPVADGYMINFSVGNATNNSFTQGGFPWVAGNGSLESSGNGVSLNNPTRDNLGSTSVEFGWVDAEYSGNNSTIWAYFADDPSINSSIKIYFDQTIFNVSLVQGWNLISFPVLSEDTNITRLIPAEARSHIFVIWLYNGSGTWKFWTELSGYTSTLNDIDVQHGYQVYCDAPILFNITGTLPESDIIPIISGDWNIVGYPRLDSTDPAARYSDAMVVWSLKNNSWYYYTTLPGYTSTLTSLDPGYGYEVYR